jgi:hypothetical protein
MENGGDSSQDTRLGMGHRGFNACGSRAGQSGAFVWPPFQRHYESVEAFSSRVHEEVTGGLIIVTCVAEGHHQRWEETHPNPNGQSYH